MPILRNGESRISSGSAPPDPRIAPLVYSLVHDMSRRRFIQAAIGAGIAVAGISAGRIFVPDFGNNPIGAVERVKQISGRIDAFLKTPEPSHLIEQAYRHTDRFYFPWETVGNISLYLFGDSMNLLDGIRGSGGTNQSGSWGDISRNNANTLLNQLNNGSGKWKYENYAIPGSSTLGLTGSEQWDHNAQLTDPDAQRHILNDPNTPIIAIGLNGNNWKTTANYAIDLYNNDPKFKQLMETLDMSNKSFYDQLLTKGEQLVMLLTDQKLCDELNTLMDLFAQDSQGFEKGLRDSFKIVEKLNTQRRKTHPQFPGIKLAVTLPIDMQLRDVVPWAPPNAPRGYRGEFNYGNVPNAKAAIYKVTSNIYTSASRVLSEYASHTNFPDAITIPFFGLEKDKKLFAPDGHFNLDGETAVALIFLKRIVTDWKGQKLSVAEIISALSAPKATKRRFRFS